MLNEVFYKGDDLSLAVASLISVNTIASNPVQSGDAVVYGDIVGVATTSAGPLPSQTGYVTSQTPGGLIAVRTKGVFNLSVTGNTGSAAALPVGTKVYIDPATGLINGNSAKTWFGWTLDAVNSGATTVVRVKLKH